MAKEVICCCGKENVNKSIKAIGQELIKRADDISRDIDKVSLITIKAGLTPGEIVNFNIVKNYIAEFEENFEANKEIKIQTPQTIIENTIHSVVD